ncbi:hypothetical protein CHT99_01330 [Sphingobacterium cellulitidis]|nr:hypothetical protein CHT99_01330 [Sphingobacterium cellulitidis]
MKRGLKGHGIVCPWQGVRFKSARGCPKVYGVGPTNRTQPAIAWCAAAETFRSPTRQWNKPGLTPALRFCGLIRLPGIGCARIVHTELIGTFLQQAGEKPKLWKVIRAIPEQAFDQCACFFELLAGLRPIDDLPDMVGGRLKGDLLQTDILKEGAVFMGRPVGQVVADVEPFGEAVEFGNRWRPPRLEIERVPVNKDVQEGRRIIFQGSTVGQCPVAVAAGEGDGVGAIVCHALPPPFLVFFLPGFLFPGQCFGHLSGVLGRCFRCLLLLPLPFLCCRLFRKYDLVSDLHHVPVIDVDGLHLGIGRDGYRDILFADREFGLDVVAIA